MRASFRRSVANRTRALFVVAVLGALVLLFIGPWVRDVVSSLYAVLPTEYQLLSRSVLMSRLTAAETELARTRYQSLLYGDALEEIARLERVLSLRSIGSYGGARVLSAPPRTQYDTLLIAAGAGDGVLVGDRASVEGFVVGVVTRVSQSSALVELYSSPGAMHDARIGNTEGVVEALGIGGGALEATVPGEIKVERGDIVRDARSNDPFGVVLSVTRREIDTEQYLSIALPVVPTSVQVVTLSHAP